MNTDCNILLVCGLAFTAVICICCGLTIKGTKTGALISLVGLVLACLVASMLK